MATNVEKSLDEIIKESKSKGRPGMRGARRGGRGGNRGGVPRNSAGGGAAGPRRFGLNNSARRQAGSVFKRRSAGGAAGGLNTSMSPKKANAVAASINGQWSHDLYQDSSKNGGALRLATTGSGPAKLVISNLDFGVNDADIQGLFQEFGKIKKAAVHYDRTGRSLGTADVLFERKQDAIRALSHYNGVSLDGRPMNIQLAASLNAPGVASVRTGGNGPNRGTRSSRGSPRGGRRGCS